MTPESVHGRWKYAEERAKGFVDNDELVILMTLPDDEFEEDGEHYVNPQFGVFNLGPKGDVQVVGIITETRDGDQEVHEVEV